jgi:hypothetical protein
MELLEGRMRKNKECENMSGKYETEDWNCEDHEAETEKRNAEESQIAKLESRLEISERKVTIILWPSGQSSWLQTQRSRVCFLVLPDFLCNSGSGTRSSLTCEAK